MVVKVYISGISGNKEVKKRQQRVLMILDSKNIKYEVIDITEPGREADKDFMQNNSKSNGGTVSDPNPRSPLPPQVFNEEEYCGDYDQFDLANEIDTLEQFLKVEVPPDNTVTEEKEKENTANGDVKLSKQESKENSQERESVERVENKSEVIEDGEVAKNETSTEDTEKEVAEESAKETPAEETPSEETAAEEKPAEKTPAEETPAPAEDQKNSEESKPTEEVESNISKEETTVSNSEASNENGPGGSREVSAEKEVKTVEKAENPSEALIQSEQVAASD